MSAPGTAKEKPAMLNPAAHQAAVFINVILATCWNAFIFTSIMLSYRRIRGHKAFAGGSPAPGGRVNLVNLIWHWSRWPALAHILSDPFLDVLISGNLHWVRLLLDAFSLYVWWMYRDAGDDDDHKKLKQKAKSMVIAIGGKLVVAPSPA